MQTQNQFLLNSCTVIVNFKFCCTQLYTQYTFQLKIQIQLSQTAMLLFTCRIKTLHICQNETIFQIWLKLRGYPFITLA